MKKFKAFYLRYRSKIITYASLLLIAVAVVNIYFVLEVRVTSNDECLWIPKKITKDSTAIFFDVVKVDGVTWNAGIRNGDQLLKINGKQLYSTFQAQQILNEFESGDHAIYTYMRDGKIFESNVYVKKLIQYGNLASTLSALFWMIIGFIVLSANPDGKVHKLFYWVAVFAVLASLHALMPMYGDFYKFMNEFGLFSILVGTLWIIGICSVPFLLVYFFWNFPSPFKFAQKKWVKRLMIILPAVISTIIIAVAFLSFSNTINMIYFWWFNRSIGYYIGAANVIALISLIIQYKRIKSKERRKPIFLFLIAFIFGIAVTVYAAQIAPMIAESFFNSPEYFAPVILVAIVPLVFAYSIFKYQLMDVSVVIKNTIIYGAATLTVAVIYFVVVYVLGQGISTALGAENQGIIAGVFFIIFALIFQSTKNRFQDFLTKRFYPEQFAHQKVLIQFSNDVSTVVGMHNILELMKKTFVEALNISKFGTLIRDNGSGALKLTSSVGLSEEECVIKNSNLVPFMKEKQLLSQIPVVEQADFQEVFPENADRLIKEEIFTIIPMVVKSKVIGLLLFGLKHSGSRFAGKDLELLYAAANQVAISIENARLYKTEVEKEKIERDLDLARKIQQGLLPQCIPDIDGLDICGEMIPAMQVGGDYFDLITLSKNKLFVVVGDVSGKGLSASLYMTKLQTMIQLSCFDHKSPKEILFEINRSMYRELDKSWFVTMTVALFDMDENTVKFCRAGHMPILSATNGTVESFRTQGLGVGLEKGLIFEKSLVEEELPLTSGQTFAFFTDGVTEAMNEHDQLFGEEKLHSILKNKSTSRSAEIVDEIWSSVNSFRGNTEVNDDMTMVVVKVK